MTNRMSSTQQRIDDQRAIVDSLAPGTERHRLATKILLLLQDSLHLMVEIETLISDAKNVRDDKPD